MKHSRIIKPSDAAYTIYKYESLGSSNTFLKKECVNLSDFSVIWTEEQTEGKGRFTRKWNSISGKDLTFSILLPLEKLKQPNWPNITQIAALAVAEMLKEYNLSALLKWPNDVLVDQKKICGILCESIEHKKKYYVILGIGLNVNSTNKILSQIDIPATSVFNELNFIVNRYDLLLKLLDKIILFFNELAENGFTSFREQIKRRLAYMNEEQTVVDGEKKYTGRIQDINKDGTLLFKCNDGTEISLHSGELCIGR